MKILHIAHALIDEARDHGFTLKPYTEKLHGGTVYCVEIRPSPFDVFNVLVIKRTDSIDGALLSAFEMAVGQNKLRRVKAVRLDCPLCHGKGGKALLSSAGLTFSRCTFCSGAKQVDAYEKIS